VVSLSLGVPLLKVARISLFLSLDCLLLAPILIVVVELLMILLILLSPPLRKCPLHRANFAGPTGHVRKGGDSIYVVIIVLRVRSERKNQIAVLHR
jgi:hypothetical protein